MTLYEKILALYPDLTANDFSVGGTIVLRNDNDGRGDYIAEWSHPAHPRPTDEQLADAENLPVPFPIPQQISDRQFFQQAAVDGLITQDEAIAAVATGTIPAVLQTIVDGITDPAEQFAAKMLLSGATVFERRHPFTEAVGAALGWTSAQIDAFFTAAHAL
jgi:hypothetical protein